MRPVSDHIRTLLFEHDYVTVPNFGAFIANYMPSNFNEFSGSLMPPQKRVAFNEILKQDDGLLATHISRRESMTIDEAKRKIQGFVTDIKDSLATDKSFTFDKIGNFSLNEENNLVFDPDRRNNFYSESFGFDSLFPRHITKEKYTYSQSFEDEYDELLIHESSYSSTERRTKLTGRRGSSWSYALYSLPILLLSSGLFIVLFSSPENTNNHAKASFNPLDYIPKKEVVAQVKVPAPIPTIIVTHSETEILKPTFESPQPEAIKSKEAEIKKEVGLVKLAEASKVDPNRVEETITKPIAEKAIATINSTQKRYLIVSGVFKSVENVQKLQSILQKNGFLPRIVKAGDLMKVVAAEADSYPEAVTLSEKHKALIGERAAIIKAN